MRLNRPSFGWAPPESGGGIPSPCLQEWLLPPSLHWANFLGHHPSLPRLQGIHWLRVLVFRRHLLNAHRPCRRKSWLLPLLPALLYLHFLDPGWPHEGMAPPRLLLRPPPPFSSSVREGLSLFRALCLTSLLSSEHRFDVLGPRGGGRRGRVLDFAAILSSFSFCFWSHSSFRFRAPGRFLLLAKVDLEILRSP